MDTEYRKKWDLLVIKLDVIERDLTTGWEVIHWVTHFPYPMYSRDYVYVWRYSVDKENRLMVLVSWAVEHLSVPEDPEYVPVRTYESQMVICPHKTFNKNCFNRRKVRAAPGTRCQSQQHPHTHPGISMVLYSISCSSGNWDQGDKSSAGSRSRQQNQSSPSPARQGTDAFLWSCDAPAPRGSWVHYTHYLHPQPDFFTLQPAAAVWCALLAIATTA